MLVLIEAFIIYYLREYIPVYSLHWYCKYDERTCIFLNFVCPCACCFYFPFCILMTMRDIKSLRPLLETNKTGHRVTRILAKLSFYFILFLNFYIFFIRFAINLVMFPPSAGWTLCLYKRELPGLVYVVRKSY